MSDQDSSKLRVSERNETCFNCRTEAVSHLQNAKTQNYKNTKTQKCKNGAKSIFPIDKENAYILQRINEGGESVHRGSVSPVFSINYGQAKEMATHNGSHLPMYQALSSISGDDKIFRTTLESIFIHFTTFGNGYACEVGTTIESPFLNFRY